MHFSKGFSVAVKKENVLFKRIPENDVFSLFF